MPPERPPLASWPPRALPEESALGWFQRLAGVNGQISARTLAESRGQNGRGPAQAELLDSCPKFPIATPQALAEATPVSDGPFMPRRGQTSRRRLDFPTNPPGARPACIAESRHYR